MARFLLFIGITFLVIGCKNIYESTAETDSYDAILFSMRQHLNDFEWNEAIDLYNILSASDQDQREAKSLYVSALMGRCGFEFVSFINDISEDLDTGAGTLFSLLLRAMSDGDTDKIADCNLADTVIQEIIADHSATATEYNMNVLNGLARIGVITNTFGADALNAVDAGFDPCDSADIANTQVQNIVSGFARVLSNIDNSSLSFLGDSLNGLCVAGQPLQLAGVCTATDPTAVTPAQICAMRRLMNGDDLGFARCSGTICGCAACP